MSHSIFPTVRRAVRRGILLFGPILLALQACSESSDTGTLPPELADADWAWKSENLTRTVTTDGIRKAEIRAQVMYGYQDTTLVRMEMPRVRIFVDSTGVELADLTSERGEMDNQTEEFIARGNVVLLLRGQNGNADRTIETPELYYIPGSDQIRSDSASILIENGQRTFMSSFRSDLNSTVIEGTDVRGGRVGGNDAASEGSDRDGNR